MGWLDSYRTASYRGIEFHVEDHEAGFGRRQVTHEYPGRDTPFTEDLGRRAREFTVEAYILGDDYAAVRDRLIAACESAGPGDLVHPYLGNMRVECTGLRVREGSREGRICRLQLTFVESGEANYPSSDSDPVKTVTGAANDAMEAARSGFVGRFFTDGFPSFVVDAAAGKLRAFSEMLSSLPVNPMGDVQAVAEWTLRVQSIRSQVMQLVTRPGDIAGNVLSVVGDIRSLFGVRSTRVLRIVRQAYEWPHVGPTDTPNRMQQRENDEAFAALVRQAATAELAKEITVRAVESAAAVPIIRAGGGDGDATSLDLGWIYQSREQAIQARDEVTDSLDAEMEHPGTDALSYRALARLRAEVVRAVPAPGLRLPSLASVTPPATLPSLVVAYGFYEDAGRAVEIASRNNVRHPGFLQGGQPLQVVTDVQ